MAKAEQKMQQENSRAAEERRMRAMSYGDVGSRRGAEVLVVDPTKSFDPSRSSVGAARPFGTGGARTKDFYINQKARTDTFVTRDFNRARADREADQKFAAGEANTRGKYTIPNVDKAVGDKNAPTKSLSDGDKVAATRNLHDGKRPYLGPESKKLNKSLDAKSLADWRSAGSESVGYTGTTVERMGNLKQLSIDDVRELLNKNK